MRYYSEMTQKEKDEIEKRRQKIHRREAIVESILSVVRPIVFTPLSIAFHAVSFVARGVGCVSSFGLLAAAYYFYESFCALKDGTPFGEIDSFEKAFAFLVFPFIAYAIAEVTERIYLYFESNAF